MVTSPPTAEAAVPDKDPLPARLRRALQRRHDPHLMLLRRGLVGAVVTPALFALGVGPLHNSTFALFATFASFASIGLVWFGGPTRVRAEGYAAFTATAAVLVVVGTLCSNTVALAVVAMFVIGFAIKYSATFGGYVAAGAGAMPLAFVLPVMLPGDPTEIVPRLAGWLIGSGAAAVAVLLFVPDMQRELLRGTAAGLCRDMADLVVGSPCQGALDAELTDVLARVRELRRTWASMPQHPAGPGLADQAYLSIMEQLGRACGFVKRDVHQLPDPELDALAFPLRHAVAETLRASGDLLERTPADPQLEQLARARVRMRNQVKGWVDGQATRQPAGETPGATDRARAEMLVGKVEHGYPLLVVSHLAVSIGANAALMAGQPAVVETNDLAPDVPVGGTSLRETTSRGIRLLRSHLHPGDLTFQQALRSALVLAVAVLLANELPLGHKFWVVLGALSVLRSSAVGTGATGMQAVLGTLIGFALSGLALQLGTGHSAWLWPAIVVAVFLCVYAPTAISFMVGQASFTLFVVFLFTVMEPSGWETGVSRLLTVTTGALIAVVGGLLLWPRGAKAVVGRQVAAFYRATGRYLDVAGHRFLADDQTGSDGLTRVAFETVESRWTADDAFSGLVAEQRTDPEVLEAWVRLLGVPSSVRQAAAVVGSLAERGYPPCSCDAAMVTVELELDRVEAGLERVATRLEHPDDTTPIAWKGDLTHAHSVLIECVTEQLAEPLDRRESAIGLLWVLESLDYLDGVLAHVTDPLDDVTRSLANTHAYMGSGAAS